MSSQGKPIQPRTPVRMCVRCGTITETPIVVCEVHQNTGPGFTVYSCRECAPHCLQTPDLRDEAR